MSTNSSKVKTLNGKALRAIVYGTLLLLVATRQPVLSAIPTDLETYQTRVMIRDGLKWHWGESGDQPTSLLCNGKIVFETSSGKGDIIIPLAGGAVFSIKKIVRTTGKTCIMTQVYYYDVIKKEVIPLITDDRYHRFHAPIPKAKRFIIVDAPCDYENRKYTESVEQTLKEIDVASQTTKRIADFTGPDYPYVMWDIQGENLFIWNVLVGDIQFARWCRDSAEVSSFFPNGGSVGRMVPVSEGGMVFQGTELSGGKVSTGVFYFDPKTKTASLFHPGPTEAQDLHWDPATKTISYQFELSDGTMASFRSGVVGLYEAGRIATLRGVKARRNRTNFGEDSIKELDAQIAEKTVHCRENSEGNWVLEFIADGERDTARPILELKHRVFFGPISEREARLAIASEPVERSGDEPGVVNVSPNELWVIDVNKETATNIGAIRHYEPPEMKWDPAGQRLYINGRGFHSWTTGEKKMRTRIPANLPVMDFLPLDDGGVAVHIISWTKKGIFYLPPDEGELIPLKEGESGSNLRISSDDPKVLLYDRPAPPELKETGQVRLP